MVDARFDVKLASVSLTESLFGFSILDFGTFFCCGRIRQQKLGPQENLD
jgi:hypothetical protein